MLTLEEISNLPDGDIKNIEPFNTNKTAQTSEGLKKALKVTSYFWQEGQALNQMLSSGTVMPSELQKYFHSISQIAFHALERVIELENELKAKA